MSSEKAAPDAVSLIPISPDIRRRVAVERAIEPTLLASINNACSLAGARGATHLLYRATDDGGAVANASGHLVRWRGGESIYLVGAEGEVGALDSDEAVELAAALLMAAHRARREA